MIILVNFKFILILNIINIQFTNHFTNSANKPLLTVLVINNCCESRRQYLWWWWSPDIRNMNSLNMSFQISFWRSLMITQITRIFYFLMDRLNMDISIPCVKSIGAVQVFFLSWNVYCKLHKAFFILSTVEFYSQTPYFFPWYGNRASI